MIHIVGVHVQVGSLVRQRCAWCGATLLDYDLNRIAVPVGQDPAPAVWSPGALVLVDEGLSVEVPHNDGHELPDGSCGKLDPEVTR